MLLTSVAAQPIEKFSQNPILGVQWATSTREAHELRWGAQPPTSIDGFPGGKRPFGPLKSDFEKNFSKGWVAARGPPIGPRAPCTGTRDRSVLGRRGACEARAPGAPDVHITSPSPLPLRAPKEAWLHFGWL